MLITIYFDKNINKGIVILIKMQKFLQEKQLKNLYEAFIKS